MPFPRRMFGDTYRSIGAMMPFDPLLPCDVTRDEMKPRLNNITRLVCATHGYSAQRLRCDILSV